MVDQVESTSEPICQKQNQVQQPLISQPTKKQQVKKVLVTPGTMSAYRELRKRQMGKVIGESEGKRNDVPLEPELNFKAETQGRVESELQPSGSKRLTVNVGEPSTQELEIQLATEITTEGMLRSLNNTLMTFLCSILCKAIKITNFFW